MPIATASVPATAIERLLQVDMIYAEPAALELARGREVLARFPGAAVVEVASHWQIPGRHGNAGNGARVHELRALIERRTPWLRARYAF